MSIALLQLIASLCQVPAASCSDPAVVQASQASCQSYFVTCVAEEESRRTYSNGERLILACMAARPAALLKERVDRETSGIRQKPSHGSKTGQVPQNSQSNRAE